VTIYRLALRFSDVPHAAILSFAQLVATLTALVIFMTMRRRMVRRLGRRADRSKRLREAAWAERGLVLLVLIIVGPLVVVPIAALVYGAVSVGASGDVTGANFVALFDRAGDPPSLSTIETMRWSLMFAGGAMMIAVVAGTAGALTIVRARGTFGALLNIPLLLPLAVPAVVLGFAYLVTFDRSWYDLRASPWLVLFAQSVIVYPFVLRSVLAVLRAEDPRLPETARTLGASTWGVWRFIELPITLRAMLVGAIFAFVVALGEFGATSLLTRPEFATVPIAIFDALGRPGAESLGHALALSTILAAVAGVGYLLIERLRFREVGEF
jgi:thiamine transport system permease protein